MSENEVKRTSSSGPEPGRRIEKREGVSSLDALRDVSLPIVIEIGRVDMTVQEVLGLGVGSVVQLDRAVGEPVDLYVSDRKLAEGEVVVVGDQFGFRITRLVQGQCLEEAA